MPKHTQFLGSAGRRLALLGLAAALPAAFLLAPAAASADTFNVVAGDASSLQSALNQAAAHVNSGGPDLVSIPAGSYAGKFSYGGDPVEVKGASQAATKLTAASGSTFLLTAPGSTVRNLSIENTEPGVIGSALWLGNGGTVLDVELVATGNNVYGLRSAGDTTVMGARVVVGAGDTGLLQGGAGTMKISGATIEDSGSSTAVGVRADAVGAVVQASHLSSRGVSRPLIATFGGSLTVRDSLLVLPAGVPATAAEVGDQNNGTNFTSKIAADRVTIVGDPAANQSGARAFANSAGDDFEVSFHDSLLVGIKHPLGCDSSTGKARTTADWSSLPATGDFSGGAGCTVARTNPVAGTPVFVDAAGGDYHQRYDSPLIDAGDPASAPAIDDLDRLSRPVGRMDLGAYEYQRRAPIVTVSGTETGATIGQDISFVSTATDPDPGDSPLTYSWSFDDGATATGPSATHAFTTPGPHTGTVTVTDPAGQSASAATTVTVLPSGSASDRTPPTITLFVRPRPPLAGTLRHGIAATIGCSEACSYRTSVLLDARTARRLHISRRVTSGRRTTTLSSAVGRRKIRIELTRRARTALRNVAGVKLLVRATATDRAGNRSASRTRRTTLRR